MLVSASDLYVYLTLPTLRKILSQAMGHGTMGLAERAQLVSARPLLAKQGSFGRARSGTRFVLDLDPLKVSHELCAICCTLRVDPFCRFCLFHFFFGSYKISKDLRLMPHKLTKT